MTSLMFSEGPPVPLLVEGVLDQTMLVQLVHDIQTATTIMNVREKQAPVGYAADEASPLTDAVDRLLAGTTRAIQVRYAYEASEWTDTICRGPNGFKLIRCRHED